MHDLNELKFIKANSNIVDVIGHFVSLKKKGANYVGLSPFCDERTPSFTVHPAKRIFKCFSSGKGGDIFDFVKEFKHIPMHEAISWLRDFYNIPKPDNEWQYKPPPPVPISYISSDVMLATFKGYSTNKFINWLSSLFTYDIISNACKEYNVGTSKHWTGANIFWYVDANNRIRSGKIMLYNSMTGKRVKEPFPHVTWVHTATKIAHFNMSICLFGEHLLSVYPNKIVKIVESEKTAIICSIVKPEFLWIASGSLTNLTAQRCIPLKGRIVILHPDVGAEDKWQEKCEQLRSLIPSADWDIKPIPGNNPKGYDLCDYILDNLI